MTKIEKVSITEKLSLFTEHWQPKIVGELDDYHIKLAKFQGDFVWHKHDDADEMFLVIAGSFTMKLRDDDIDIQQGEFIIIPKGVEHCPSAENEVQVMLFEKAGTLNTGNIVDDEKTTTRLSKL
ncbi:MAG: cupin domain-containing protein [Phototrophicaceae bacterium]